MIGDLRTVSGAARLNGMFLEDARGIADVYLMCTCPRDPDDEIDPGDPLHDCPIHGWNYWPAVFAELHSEPPVIVRGEYGWLSGPC